ncbi:quinone-dependent dihydroorotate dehydrogenase [Mesoterricola silvestris]|uniref:Dihydroorotate dehydrogenase (quinone) n=1 Tax=Mesoterricola silvestris TaxID=2927979 RepID=A0AA48GKP4_9BACT|nr:quinone-dependent dihydroorotate dehydrogenase [Mesoterricola silvestris]BDU72984.1 dihydroorotate dehydrogenase (quinone) [Mesoterricola silvestris]
MIRSFDPYALLRPLIFRMNPEMAHHAAFTLGGVAQRVPGVLGLTRSLCGQPDPGLAREVLGLRFPSPVGLAAGLDKGAELLPLWKALGFGFVEIGTVTPRPQAGNPKPRVFRFPEENLILNRMGFNSEGAEVVARRLKRRPAGLVVGGNIGKNKETPEEEALKDYEAAFRAIAPLVDYVALNISSPNTPGLRRLQAPEQLKPLLEGVLALRKDLALERQPLLVKLAPDLDARELDATVDVIVASGVTGLIATNTTLDRNIVSEMNRAKVDALGMGGLSGRGLKIKAREIHRQVLSRIPPHIKLMACGGIGSGEDAAVALQDGAALVQIYSSLIFEGPMLVGRMNRDLAERTYYSG